MVRALCVHATFGLPPPLCACCMHLLAAAVRAHRVATGSSWAPHRRNRPAAAARVGGGSCRSRWRPPPLAENGALRLLGACFSPRGRTEHIPGEACMAEIGVVLHSHGTGRGPGAASQAPSLGPPPVFALENRPDRRNQRLLSRRARFQGLRRGRLGENPHMPTTGSTQRNER